MSSSISRLMNFVGYIRMNCHSYLSLAESLPNYGVHYYQVKDKRNIRWWLGISYQGIAQYDYTDRTQPRRVFQWKQLENLYFRDRKFSIEVHDPKSSDVYTSSSQLENELIDQLNNESTRCGGRSGGGAAAAAALRGSISVIVWFGQTQALTKNIWHMAICQHQFYLDRRPDSFSKSHHHHLKVPQQQQQQQQPPPRNLNDIALDLSKSSTSLSLSTASNCSSAHSHSNLSHCGSTQTLNKMGHTPQVEAEESEAARAARLEIVSALKARKTG